LKYAEIARDTSSLIVSNIGRAASLIQSFKQVAVDQTSGERRTFEVAGYIHEIIRSLTPRLKQTPHEVQVDCPPGLIITSYPGALAQLITNLIMNSLVHAYPDDRTGLMEIIVTANNDNTLTLTYSDDGVGIREGDRARVFDPFFTTRRAEGGTGLGLHIVYNIVTQTLMGTITMETGPDGTCFAMVFPVPAKRSMEMVHTL
jgi:signal transduction histidine kinase